MELVGIRNTGTIMGTGISTASITVQTAATYGNNN
jgi:hypothetical protein